MDVMHDLSGLAALFTEATAGELEAERELETLARDDETAVLCGALMWA